MFEFSGRLQTSKSLMNRALIVKSFFPELQIQGFSNCQDVQVMQAALDQMTNGEVIHCGEAGTVFRFMALRASREVGEFFITGAKRLLARPHVELYILLQQLGVQAVLSNEGLRIKSQGWKTPDQPVKISTQQSSQFLSAVALSSWNLSQDLTVQTSGEFVSEGYWKMTAQLLIDLGLDLQFDKNLIKVRSQQKIKKTILTLEQDMSSIFAIAAAAVIDGNASFLDIKLPSQQPDSIFIQFLQQMNVKILLNQSSISTQKTQEFGPLQAQLKDCPDLFPVLAALCAFAKGTSLLHGAPHLILKESNRLQNTFDLLKQAGVRAELQDYRLTIHGQGRDFRPCDFIFDPDQDHRMAMAASLFALVNSNIKIKEPQVVNKSFPEFWTILKGADCNFS